MMYPPSMIAAGSVGAAINGLNSLLPNLGDQLLDNLHEITGIEMVSKLFCSSTKGSVCWENLILRVEGWGCIKWWKLDANSL